MNETSNSPAPPPISVEEYRQRIAATQTRMDEVSLDALFITSEDNYRYLTGFDAPVWQNLTRPRYCVLPTNGDPILILPSGNEIIAWRTTPWIKDILSWVAPQASHPAALLVMQLVEPIMAPVRKVIPPLGMIDLSPIVVFISISLLDNLVVGSLTRAAGVSGALVGL